MFSEKDEKRRVIYFVVPNYLCTFATASAHIVLPDARE